MGGNAYSNKPARNQATGSSSRKPQSNLGERSPARQSGVQSLLGNQGVLRRTQTNLLVNQPGDSYEREANRMADRVMRMPNGGQAGPAREQPQSKRDGSVVQGSTVAPPIVQEVLNSPGRPLDAATRSFMESRFGMDFGPVRLHTGGRAAESANTLGARAYTKNRNIVFAKGQYAPDHESGRRLLAHELAHVTQQGNGGATPIMREPDDEKVVDGQEPHKIEGTPFSVTPLEPARGDEAINVLGYRLPYRAVRITNETDVTPLPKLPRHWRDVPDLFHLDNAALSRFAVHRARSGTAGALDDLPGLVDVERAPPEQPTAEVPRFSLTVRSDGFGLDVLDKVMLSLYPEVVRGTPPLRGSVDEDNLRRDAILNPSLSIHKRIYAAGTLSLRDPYPLHSVLPTEIGLEAHSVPLGSITAKEDADRLNFGTVGSVRVSALGIAGAKGDVEAFIDIQRINAALSPIGLDDKESKVLIHEIAAVLEAKVAELSKNPTLDTVVDAVRSLDANGPLRKSLEEVVGRHVKPGIKQSVVQHAVEEVMKELSGPGFSVHGPLYFGVPIGYASFTAPTTRYLRAPFEGSGIGTPFPATLKTIGPTLIPAGVLSSNATPAGGGILARDFESFALSATVAGKPYLDPGVIGAAGVASVRAGFRVKGFEVVIEGGWRGQAPLLGGAKSAGADLGSDLKGFASARQQAEASYNEKVNASERGAFDANLRPPEVLPDVRPDAEFYGSFHIGKKF